MEQLLQQLGNLRNLLSQTPEQSVDSIQPDTSETVKISALALLKMLTHARRGVPLEVMGLMLGEFVDDYTITVVDVFAMPQSGTSVSVESVDPVYQAKMADLLKITQRKENVVGWYHSHPGFGCWLSSVDQHTQQSFEQLNPRAIAVVVDPIQSVKGKVLLEAFRLFPTSASFQLPGFSIVNSSRETTSCIGAVANHAGAVALVNGLGKKYYSLVCDYKLGSYEQRMLQSLDGRRWTDAFKAPLASASERQNGERLGQLLKYAKLQNKELESRVADAEPVVKKAKKETAAEKEKKKAIEEAEKYGKTNARLRLEETARSLMEANITEQLTNSIAASTLQ